MAAADSQSHPELDSKGILSPKLSPIKAKSVVTPDGLTTPNVHPSSGKSTSTPGTVCVYVHVCEYVCLRVCVCICTCVYICVCRCVCVCRMCVTLIIMIHFTELCMESLV